jgi:predicted PurR-regulated permease PerM
LIIIGLAAALVYWLLSKVWVGVRPILLGIIVSTVLWPPVAWLRRHSWPAALAAITVLALALAVAGGVLYLTARPIVAQSVDLANSAAEGIQRLEGWLTGPPLDLSGERLNTLTAAAVDRLRSSAADIASGVFRGVSVVSDTVVTAVLVLVLAFFFIKDGAAFLPWLRRWTGPSIGAHLTEVLARAWQTLSNFIRVQALVSLVDAVLIGLGLVLLGVPLAPALAVLTFIAGFVPIVGAITAGAIAVLVALVSNGFTTALLVLALIVVVQQLESNVLRPFLQGRSLNLHAAVVLLAVTAGGTLYGIIGAFLAVPVAAITATVLRYISEQIALRTGEMQAADVSAKTAEGSFTAREGERAASRVLRRWRRHENEQAP